MSPTRHIPIDDAGPAVRDVMLKDPRTVGPDTPVAEVRETFANPHVKLMLVADGDRFLGTLTPDAVDGRTGTVAALVDPDTPHLAPDDTVSRALELLGEDVDRVPVVDED